MLFERRRYISLNNIDNHNESIMYHDYTLSYHFSHVFPKIFKNVAVGSQLHFLCFYYHSKKIDDKVHKITVTTTLRPIMDTYINCMHLIAKISYLFYFVKTA